MCTAFSTWRRLNATRAKSSGARRRAYKDACEHMEFVAQFYNDQIAENRYFLHEHPQFASSWNLECMRRLMQLPGVGRTCGDQCQYGAEAPHGPLKGSPVMKPTGLMSNSREILEALSKRCTSSRASASDSTASTGTWSSRKEGSMRRKHLPKNCKVSA